MKIDMSAKAITSRLKTVSQLRKACLSLANSSAGKIIRKQFTAKSGKEEPCPPHPPRHIASRSAPCGSYELLGRLRVKSKKPSMGSETGSV